MPVPSRTGHTDGLPGLLSRFVAIWRGRGMRLWVVPEPFRCTEHGNAMLFLDAVDATISRLDKLIGRERPPRLAGE